MKIEGGATIWARQTIESEIFINKPDKWFKIWFFIINKVRYKKMGQFEKGQNFIKYQWISDSTGATKGQIDMFIRWAKKCQMLTTQKTTRGMIVNVLKYEVYQDLENYKNDTENETLTTQKRHRNDTILKKDKKDKKEHPPQTEKVFSFQSYLTSMKGSTDKRMFIIYAYWIYKQFTFENREQTQRQIKRDLRPATDLVCYSGQQIKNTFDYLRNKDFKWTLETVIKYINEYGK